MLPSISSKTSMWVRLWTTICWVRVWKCSREQLTTSSWRKNPASSLTTEWTLSLKSLWQSNRCSRKALTLTSASWTPMFSFKYLRVRHSMTSKRVKWPMMEMAWEGLIVRLRWISHRIKQPNLGWPRPLQVCSRAIQWLQVQAWVDLPRQMHQSPLA